MLEWPQKQNELNKQHKHLPETGWACYASTMSSQTLGEAISGDIDAMPDLAAAVTDLWGGKSVSKAMIKPPGLMVYRCLYTYTSHQHCKLEGGLILRYKITKEYQGNGFP